MTQDTKYLDAYIKYKFNISKVLEKIGFNGWNKVVEWYESEKYKKIINSKEIEVYFIENLYDDSYHIDNNFGKIDHIPGDDVKCFKYHLVVEDLLKQICKEFINSDLSKGIKAEKLCDEISDSYHYNLRPDVVLAEDPFFKEELLRMEKERIKMQEGKFSQDKIKSIDVRFEINKIRKSLKFQFSDNFQIDGELYGDSRASVLAQLDNNMDYNDREKLKSLNISPKEEEFLLKGFTNTNQTSRQKKRIIEKRATFRNLAQSRIVAALDSIRKISNCSNKSHYTFTYEEIKEMRDTLVDKINEEFSKFGFVKDKSLEIKIEDKKSKEKNIKKKDQGENSMLQKLGELEEQMMSLKKQIKGE